MLKISNDARQINERFFMAVDALKRQRKLSGIYGFATTYSISPWNLYMVKKNQQGTVKAEYLTFLVRDFGVSAKWLLTGEGGMFKHSNAQT